MVQESNCRFECSQKMRVESSQEKETMLCERKNSSMTSETTPQANWVRAWYAAPCRMFLANLSGRTLRQIIHLHAGGEQLRLCLSNRYGDAPVTLSSLSV